MTLAGAAAVLAGSTSTASAQPAAVATNFLQSASSAPDSQLGSIASELVGKSLELTAAGGTSSATQAKLDSVLKPLTGGNDSTALTSAFNLAKSVQFTPEQLGLAKQVGNLTSAYVVQKNIATNAHLTDDQETLISKVADQYAPGWKKTGAAMDAIKKLPGF